MKWAEDDLLEAGACAVLAVRPALDVFSARSPGLSLFAVTPAVALGLGVLFVAVVVAVRRLRDREPLWPDPGLRAPHLWLLAAYGIGLGSALWLHGASGAATGLREVVRVASIIAALLVVLWWVQGDPARYRRGWAYLSTGVAVPVGVALWQLFTQTGYLETEGLNRLRGSFSHPNSLGPFLAVFVLIAVAGLPAARGRARAGRFGLAVGLTFVAALTLSRTAALVLATGLVALVAFQLRRASWRELLWGPAAIAVGGLLALAWAGNVARERFTDLSPGEVLETLRTGASVNSITWRALNWDTLVRLGLEHPWLGHGIGMTTVLNPDLSAESGVPSNAHNDFVRLFFEAGVAGLVCYLIYGALLARWLLGRVRPASRGRWATASAVAAAWLALFFLTLGLPELSLQTAVLYSLYGLIALLCAPEGGAENAAR